MKIDGYSMYDFNIEKGYIFSYYTNSRIGCDDRDYIRVTIKNDDGVRGRYKGVHQWIWVAVNGDIPERL